MAVQDIRVGGRRLAHFQLPYTLLSDTLAALRVGPKIRKALTGPAQLADVSSDQRLARR